jgi:hypothetical protein
MINFTRLYFTPLEPLTEIEQNFKNTEGEIKAKTKSKENM